MTTAIEASEQDMAKVVTMRDAIAIRIKDLSGRWAENTIAIGREFKRARDSFPVNGNQRPGWHDWVHRNTPWKHNHATKFIRVTERCGKLIGSSSSTTTTLTLEVLNVISGPEVPEELTREVVGRAAQGEQFTVKSTRALVEERTRPKPKEANEKARETGKAVLASDGNYYFGATKEQAEAYEKKIKIVYTVRRAIEDLANVGMSASAFLKYAEKHQLWRSNEEHLLNDAHDWLSALLESWGSR